MPPMSTTATWGSSSSSGVGSRRTMGQSWMRREDTDREKVVFVRAAGMSDDRVHVGSRTLADAWARNIADPVPASSDPAWDRNVGHPLTVPTP